MKEYLVPEKQSQDLKELGFDELCLFFHEDGDVCPIYHQCDITSDMVLAPLYQQAFRWFRNKYGFVSEIQTPDGKNGVWHPTIHKIYGFGNHYDNDGFNSYEEAELASIKKLIEIVKNG
tara:strand:+ start:91 stop:447 length:357 start_codon:yes stop_codon:yes gene_type:complete